MLPQIICIITGFIFGLLLGMIAYQQEKLKANEELKRLELENIRLRSERDFYKEDK